ncbi:c-type cytochrome [Chloroflexota bacterium]
MAKLSLFITILLITVILVVSCGGSQSTTTPPPTTTTTTTQTTPTSTTPVTTITTPPVTTTTTTPILPTTTTTGPPPTAGELAVSGKILYNQTCTYPDCHAAFTEGSDFNGPDMSQFANAGLVFNIISDIMHLGISDMQEEGPSDEDYLQILAFLLIQGDYVQPNDQLNRDNLTDILLASLTTTTPTTITQTTTAPPTTSITPPTNTTTTTPTPTTTWGELATRGAGAFSSNCAACHGEDGEGDFGPAIIGTTLTLYGTAWKLLAFISTNMPQDGPGSLSANSYQRLLAFMLIKSGFVAPEVIFDENDLVNVLIE